MIVVEIVDCQFREAVLQPLEQIHPLRVLDVYHLPVKLPELNKHAVLFLSTEILHAGQKEMVVFLFYVSGIQFDEITQRGDELTASIRVP